MQMLCFIRDEAAKSVGQSRQIRFEQVLETTPWRATVQRENKRVGVIRVVTLRAEEQVAQRRPVPTSEGARLERGLFGEMPNVLNAGCLAFRCLAGEWWHDRDAGAGRIG